MNNFVSRIANYVANEILIKGLANSRTFQRFAVRTDQTWKEMKKTGTEHISTAFEEAVKQQVRHASSSSKATASGAAGTAGGPPTPPLRGFPGFVSAFFKEIRQDLGMGR